MLHSQYIAQNALDMQPSLTPAAKQTRRDGLRIKHDNCYEMYERSRVTIAPPAEVEFGISVIHMGKFSYRYILPNGTEYAAPLKIDFPLEPGTEVICKSGLKHKLDYTEEEKALKTKDKTYKMQGTPNGNYKAFCELNPAIPEHVKLQVILMDLYQMAIDWMAAYGTKGSVVKLRKEYSNKGEDKNPNDWKTYFFDHLTPPVWFKDVPGEREVAPNRFVPTTLKDFNSPSLITLSVNSKPTNVFPTTFYEITEKLKTKVLEDGSHSVAGEIDDDQIPPERLIGTGFRIVPLIEPVIIVCPESLVKLNTESAIISDWIPLSAMEQASTLEDMKRARAGGRTNVSVRSHMLDVLNQADADTKTVKSIVHRSQIDEPSDDDDVPPASVLPLAIEGAQR